MNDKLFDYLVATDSLDDFLGYELICPNCNNKLEEIQEENKIFYRCNICNRIYDKDLNNYIDIEE